VGGMVFVHGFSRMRTDFDGFRMKVFIDGY
jgi:hypothetical protein